jgi:hypothetical protein
VQLTWSNSSTNEIGFALERSLDGINFTVIGGVGANLTNTLDSELNASTTYYYRIRATNAVGSAVSPIATVVTPGPPRIIAPPQSQVANVGSSVPFSVVADGLTPFRYQWFFNSNAIANATNSLLKLLNVQDANAGFYHVTVSNTAATKSSVALLTLNHFPVVNAPTFTRPWYGGFKARTNAFSATDPDGDAVAFSLAAISSNNVPITRRGAWFFYSPGNFTNSDSFALSVTDARNATNFGTALVQLTNDTSVPKDLFQQKSFNTLSFAGVPNRTYAIEFTDEQHPVWQTLTNLAADALGELSFSDTPPSGITNRAYRASVPRP